MRRPSSVPCLLAAFFLVHCSERSGEGKGDLTPPEAFTPEATAAYPDGPYGVARGDTISDYTFSGLVDSVADSGKKQVVRLSDFYNPTGTGTYPEGSQYGEGQPKPQALLVNVSALWCGPCKEEARGTLPVKYAELKPLGAEFFVVLAEGGQPGTPIEWSHLLTWTRVFDLDYPAGIDPEHQLSGAFPASAYPANMLVDTKTMRIVKVVLSAPDEGFWDQFRASLGE